MLSFRKFPFKHSVPCPSGIYWEVSPGDTLYLIAKKLNIPLKKLLAANPDVDPRNLQIGSKICIPKVD
nr:MULTISPECIES: LysM domain-containing protein [Thermincola]